MVREIWALILTKACDIKSNYLTTLKTKNKKTAKSESSAVDVYDNRKAEETGGKDSFKPYCAI